MILGAKNILKIAALIVLALEVYWVIVLGKEPHPMSIAGALTSLFGMNSVHENVKQFLSEGDDK